MRLTRVVLTVVLLTSAAVVHAADQSKFPSNEDLRHFRWMEKPVLSPDGRRVLVEIADSTADGGRRHLWLVDIDHDSYRQLTFSLPGKKDDKDSGERSGEWMPNGDILFVAHRGERNQLFRLPMQGGEAVAFDLEVVPQVDMSKSPDAVPPPQEGFKDASTEKLGKPLPLDISGFQIAPDGKTIAVWAKDPQTPGEKKQHDEKADAVWVDHEQHITRLYLLDPATSNITALPVPGNVDDVVWSDASERLLAEVEAPNGASDLGPARSTWVVMLKDVQHPQKLTEIPATARRTAWAKDGQRVYFLAQAKHDAPPGYDDLYQLVLANGSIQNLSDGAEFSIGFDHPIAQPGGGVLVAVENHTENTVARFLPGKTADIVHFGVPVIRGLNTNSRNTGWVYLGSGSTQPVTLYYTEKLGLPGRALATPSMVPPNLRAPASQVVRWNNDGLTLEGLLYLPPQAAGQKVPLVVDAHGGPLGAWVDSWEPFVSFLVGHGWAVFRPNPRGGSGRGAEFAAANKNDLGGGDFRDLMAGVDAAVKGYPVDPARMALIGYSYGGEMAGFVEGKTDRFKAIVSGAPVIDQFSEYGTERDSWYDRWYFGKPWERMADAWRQSPLSGAAQAKTPFLLLQGEGDTTDPLGQSLEMYRALRQMGAPVEMVRYPRDDHGPLAVGMLGLPSLEPWHGFDARQRMVKFIERGFSQASAQSAKADK